MYTIQELAEHLRQQFETKFRNEDEMEGMYYRAKDDAPQAAKDLVFLVHERGDWLPDDYRYAYMVDALERIAGSDDPEESRDYIEPDVYNSDLIEWAASHPRRFNGYCDEALSELGDQARGFIGLIAFAQQQEREEVYETVLGFLTGATEAQPQD